MTGTTNRDDRDDLAGRVTAAVADHDPHMRAAVRLVSGSLLLGKIGGYVEQDGWIEWDRLTGDLIGGLPWSSGELRVARLACSLSGQMAYLEDDDQVGNLVPWTLAELLYGLDDRNRAAVLDAIHYAATGRPIGPLDRTVGRGADRGDRL